MGYKKNALFTPNGARGWGKEEREVNDYYATDPQAMEMLLQKETFSKNVWECACGGGHLTRVLQSHGYNVKNTDIVNRGVPGMKILDFLQTTETNTMDIITNPPYKMGKEFVEHALEISTLFVKVAMFLKLTFLEGKERRKLFDTYPPKVIYVFSSRIPCAMNGDFSKYAGGVSSACAYAWFIWEKGFQGDPIIKWL